MPLLRPAATALLDLLLPGACAGCGCPGSAVCDLCFDDLADGVSLWQPSPPPRGLPRCARAAPYDGIARSALIAFKEHGRADVGRPLGAALAGAVTLLAGGTGPPVALVPVPASPAALRRRGRDHVLQLARAAAAQLRGHGVPVRVLPLLRPTRSPADQSGLDAPGRAVNVRDAFAARAGYSTTTSEVAIVVDDIITTGATAAECATTLAAAGWPVAGVATVAAAVLRRQARTVGRLDSDGTPLGPTAEVRDRLRVVSRG